jgi:hypothetical protein
MRTGLQHARVANRVEVMSVSLTDDHWSCCGDDIIHEHEDVRVAISNNSIPHTRARTRGAAANRQFVRPHAHIQCIRSVRDVSWHDHVKHRVQRLMQTRAPQDMKTWARPLSHKPAD